MDRELARKTCDNSNGLQIKLILITLRSTLHMCIPSLVPSLSLLHSLAQVKGQIHKCWTETGDEANVFQIFFPLANVKTKEYV